MSQILKAKLLIFPSKKRLSKAKMLNKDCRELNYNNILEKYFEILEERRLDAIFLEDVKMLGF